MYTTSTPICIAMIFVYTITIMCITHIMPYYINHSYFVLRATHINRQLQQVETRDVYERVELQQQQQHHKQQQHEYIVKDNVTYTVKKRRIIPDSLLRVERRMQQFPIGHLPVLSQLFVVELRHCNWGLISLLNHVADVVTTAVLQRDGGIIHHVIRDPVGARLVVNVITSDGYVLVNTWSKWLFATVHISMNNITSCERIARFIERGLMCRGDRTLWSLRPEGGHTLASDVSTLYQLRLRKKLVTRMKSPYQTISVYDVPYDNLLQSGGFQGGGRVLFLDGCLQSAQYDEHIYHEALVHPAMLSHPNPSVVVVIGGGEGATIREVLRHRSVTKCIMVELDPLVTTVAFEHLPTWHNGAFNDPRLEVHFMDGQSFLESLPDRFIDVIILDILDPGMSVADERAHARDHSHTTFSNPLFYQSFYELVRRKIDPYHGVVVTNTGGIDLQMREWLIHTEGEFDHEEVWSELSSLRVLANLQRVIPSATQYSTYIPSFQGEWTFSIALMCPPPQEHTEYGCDALPPDYYTTFHNFTEPIMPQCSGPSRVLSADYEPSVVAQYIEDNIQARVSGELKFYDAATHLRMFLLPKTWRDTISDVGINIIE